jgi:transglutaminase-like putative cysteine protease
MAELNLPMNRSTSRKIGGAAVAAPRLLMSWEDWLTFGAVLVTFLSVAASLQQANWVPDMPALVPTALAALVVGLFAARIRLPALFIQPIALAIGLVVVVLVSQSYADGLTLSERLTDFRLRMEEWYRVVRAGDISNDNLPFVTLVQGITFLSAYLASFSIYRWHNAWFAVIPGGVVLLANISFLRGQPSGAFVVFLFGAILLISRAHLQRNQVRWRKQQVEYPDFISLSAAQLTLLLSVVLVAGAWLVPMGAEAGRVASVFNRVVEPFTGHESDFARLFHNIDSQRGANIHNFGSTLPIQGNVKLGSAVLFEVTASQPGLVRATSYDEYTGTGWKATRRESKRTEAQTDLPSLPPEAVYKQRAVSPLHVQMQSSQSVLLSPGIPLATNVDFFADSPRGAPVDVERLRSQRGLRSGDTYTVLGSESTASDEELSAAGTDYPGWVTDRYLQLPKNLPARVAEEARNRTQAGAGTPYAQAKALEEYLRSFPYDLAVESAPPKRDSVDFFLFDLKRGYFDYQATAMAVMLRTLGVPARVAVGYVLDPTAAQDTKYTVRKDQAYTWVEVFFPGYGWVNFNPTQDRPAGGAGGIGQGNSLVDPGTPLPSLEELFVDPLGDVTGGSDVVEALQETPIQHSDPPWTLIWSLAGVLALIVAGLIAGKVTWNWGLSDLSGRARLWAKVHRLARWSGLGGPRSETPREWSHRVGEAAGCGDDAARLAAAYEEARYGRPDLQRIDDEDATGAYRRMRNALGNHLLHRSRKR